MANAVAALLAALPLAIPITGPAAGATLIIRETALQKLLDATATLSLAEAWPWNRRRRLGSCPLKERRVYKLILLATL